MKKYLKNKHTMFNESTISSEDSQIQTKKNKRTQTDLKKRRQMECNPLQNLILFIMFLIVGVMIELFLNFVFNK